MEDQVTFTFIRGDIIELWAPTLEKVNLYAKWINLPMARAYSRVALPKSVNLLKKILEPKSDEIMRTDIFLEIYHRDDKKSIGIVGLNNIDWINRKANISIIIGESDYWGKGLAIESLKLLFSYAFEDLNLHKLNAIVHTPNERSLRVFEKLNLSCEATLKDEIYVDGRYYDSKIFSLYKKDWLNRNKEEGALNAR
jgi:RimJ/RimL family protein N-acetyltransferase